MRRSADRARRAAQGPRPADATDGSQCPFLSEACQPGSRLRRRGSPSALAAFPQAKRHVDVDLAKWAGKIASAFSKTGSRAGSRPRSKLQCLLEGFDLIAVVAGDDA